MKTFVKLKCGITIAIFLNLIFTSCVSINSNRVRFDTVLNNRILSFNTKDSGCSEAYENRLKVLISESIQIGSTCLVKIGGDRKSDAQALEKLISTQDINLRCNNELDPENIAFANSKEFPGMSINTNFLSASELTELKPVFFHESLHWLNYKHYDGVDVPYLAEACCFEVEGMAKNQSKALACSMLNLKSEAWTTPSYNENLTTVLSNFGRGFIGLRTAWNASIYLNRHKSSKNAYLSVLYASLKALNRGFYESKYTQSNDLLWIKTENPTYGVIVGNIVQQNSDGGLKRDASAYIKSLQNRFFIENKHDKTVKLDFFYSLSQSLSGLLTANSAVIVEGWEKLSLMAYEVCPKLSKQEQSAIENILAATHLAVFDLKNELPVYILKQWRKPCGLKSGM